MLITILMFLVLRTFLTMPICEWMVINVSGIRYLLALLMFIGAAMAAFRQTRMIGVGTLIGSILLYVGTSTVLPYYNMLATVLAVVLALTVLLEVKRWTIPMIRRATFNGVVKALLYLV